jgi:glycine cleavage system H protein
MTLEREGTSLFPPEEAKCVLMTAGVLTYRLCDRDYDCENCPLFQAVRQASRAESLGLRSGEKLRVCVDLSRELRRLCGDDEAKLRLLDPFARLRVRKTLYYGPHHTWLRVHGMNLCRVGIDDLLASALPQIDVVVPAEAGHRVKTGQPLAWLIVAGEMVPVRSPLSSRVVRTNPEVLANPALVRGDSYEEGWVAEVEPEDLPTEVRELEYGEAVCPRLSETALRLCRAIVAELDQAPQIGRMSQDGGRVVDSAAEALGVRRYVQILRSVLWREE